MYKPEDMIPEILENFPGFKGMFKEYKDYYAEDLPIGCDVGEFSLYTKEILQGKRKDDLQAIFALIEKFLERGDEMVKNYCYFEFFENLSNEYDGYTEEDLRKYMGPLSHKALDRIEAFWMEGKIIESLD